MGSVLLDGYGCYGVYIKELLEKFKVIIYIFCVGIYKFVVEFVMCNDMLEVFKEVEKKWLEVYWFQYKEDVVNVCGIFMDNFDEILEVLVVKFEQVDGDFVQYVVENKWVDVFKICEDVCQEFVEFVGEDDNFMGVNIMFFDIYFSVINVFVFFIFNDFDKIVVVVVKGSIIDGIQ